MSDPAAKPRPWDKIPGDLHAVLQPETAPEAVLAAAAFDLDDDGRYMSGWLVHVPGRLGRFVKDGGAWTGQWVALPDSGAESILIEGIGMGVLRIVAEESILLTARFSRRHAADVARLHRSVERALSGKEEPAERAPGEPAPDSGKARCETCGGVIPAWSEVCPACLSRRRVLARLMDFAKPYKWSAIAGFSLALLATVSLLVRPYLTRPMLDYGLGTAPGHAADYGLLLRYILLMAALTLFNAAAEAFRERLMARLGSRVGRDIRDRTYAHLHKLSLSFFAKKPTGSLVTRITSDSDRIWDFIAFTLVELAIAILTIVGVGVALFLLDWRLAGIALLPVPVMLAFTVLFHRRLRKGFRRMWHRWSRMTALVADALPGVRVIKAFSQETREIHRFADRNRDYYDDEVAMIGVWTLFHPVMHLCTQIGTLLVWIVGGYWVVQGRMSAGTLMAYVGYMWMFYGPIHMIAHMDRLFNRAATSVQRIFEILDTQPAIFSQEAAAPVDRIEGAIELRGVAFSYDGVRNVLQDVSLRIEPGEIIGLAGPSGGGKTTLVNLVCRFYDVCEGSILIDGRDVRTYDVEALRRRIGVVLQEPFLFHGTVAENIAYGCPDASLPAIMDAARAANAHDFIVGFPDAYDTLVGERGQTLSGGERQRISIARAILNNPSILILDEATSSVDTETEKLIQEALDRLIARRTTIAIAHRLSTLRKADRLVILDKGRIVEQGTHEELQALPDGLYAKLTRLQAETQSSIAIAG